ncbi:hypothetical protein SBOR_9172 [Sclerotinia borealis F-4128]|uniref:Uncharacterized protein n=1 Tax=Sclerotinia borealis (strain F-4128) TaxID=1432307 RepID=W9C0X4_SCLBF|nr:hypothetical protein SBOR_9172 [Sclerotinia borealis F-4128]
MKYIPLELLRLLAEQRLPLKTLTALCLTSKTFNEIFRPVLYRKIVLPDGKSRYWKYQQLRVISQLPIETHLRHTRSFDPDFVGEAIRACLLMCLRNMLNLEDCSICTLPAFAGSFHVNKITDVCVEYLRSEHPMHHQLDWPDVPSFRNLRSLDLRNLKGDLSILGSTIAKILFNDGRPAITALGLGVDLAIETEENLFRNIAAEFDDLKRANRTPDLRLSLQNLILGDGMYSWSSVTHDGEWRLSKLSDMSKLRTLRLLNGQIDKHIDVKIFDGITALEKLSVELCNGSVMQLLLYLNTIENSSIKTTLREFQAGNIDIPDANSPVVDGQHVSLLINNDFFKWRQLLIAGNATNNEELFEWPWQGSPYQWEELGIEHLDWDLRRDTLLSLSNLRILMCIRATATIGDGKHAQEILDNEGASNLAKTIFTAFREHAKKQGRISKLRYVGLKGWIFTYLWLPNSGLNGGRTKAEVVQLDDDEAMTFDFIRMNEKLTIVKYRLGGR